MVIFSTFFSTEVNIFHTFSWHSCKATKLSKDFKRSINLENEKFWIVVHVKYNSSRDRSRVGGNWSRKRVWRGDDELVENDLPSPSSNLFPMMDHCELSETHSSSGPPSADLSLSLRPLTRLDNHLRLHLHRFHTDKSHKKTLFRLCNSLV